MANEEILALKDRFVEQLAPLKVYLFGSFADGVPNADSDYDFYIVLDDSRTDWQDETRRAYRAIRHVRTRPVDILVGTEGDFNARKDRMTIEREVYRKGVLLYG